MGPQRFLLWKAAPWKPSPPGSVPPRGPLGGSPSAATPGHRQGKGAGSGLSVVLQCKQEGSSGKNQQPRVTAHHRGRINGPPDCAPQLPGGRSLNRDPPPQPHLLKCKYPKGGQDKLGVVSTQPGWGARSVDGPCWEFQGGSVPPPPCLMTSFFSCSFHTGCARFPPVAQDLLCQTLPTEFQKVLLLGGPLRTPLGVRASRGASSAGPLLRAPLLCLVAHLWLDPRGWASPWGSLGGTAWRLLAW